MRFTAKQRQALTTLLRRPDLRPLIQARALALLRAEEREPYATIASATGLGMGSVRQLRRRFAERGLDRALYAAGKPNITIQLTRAERKRLQRLARQAPDPTWVPQRARLLLQMDQGVTDYALAHRFHVGPSMLSELRRRFAQGGLEAALHASGMKRGRMKLTDQRRRRLLALARSKVPSRDRPWGLRELAQEAVKRGIVDYISHETIRKILKDGGVELKLNKS